MRWCDRLVVAFLILAGVMSYIRMNNATDAIDELNKAIKTLAAATLETKMHCDVAGERTDELWEEVFNAD